MNSKYSIFFDPFFPLPTNSKYSVFFYPAPYTEIEGKGESYNITEQENISETWKEHVSVVHDGKIYYTPSRNHKRLTELDPKQKKFKWTWFDIRGYHQIVHLTSNQWNELNFELLGEGIEGYYKNWEHMTTLQVGKPTDSD